MCNNSIFFFLFIIETKKETNEENVEQQTPLTDPEENIVEVKSADYRYSNLFSQDEGDLILSNPIRMPFKKPSDASNKTNKNEIHKDFLIYECDYEPMVKELLEYYSEQVIIIPIFHSSKFI